MWFKRRMLISAAAASMLPMAARARSTTLLANSFLPPQHPVTRLVIAPWAERVTNATEGRVRIDIAPSSLAAPQHQLSSVVRGIFDIAYQFHGLVADTVKLNQIAKLPFVNTTARGSSVSLWRTYNQYFVRANELAQVQVLALFVLPPGVLFGMDRPIQSIADLRGRRVFSIPGVPARFVEATGAGVVAVPAARSHEIISGGTVDAFASYSVSDAYALRTLPFARHVTDLPGGMTAPSFALIVNQRRWQALPSRDRDIILSLSGEVFARQMAVYDELEARARSVAVTNGIQFHQATDAFVQDLRRLATPLKDSWLADATNLGVNGREAMDFYVAQARANQ